MVNVNVGMLPLLSIIGLFVLAFVLVQFNLLDDQQLKWIKYGGVVIILLFVGHSSIST